LNQSISGRETPPKNTDLKCFINSENNYNEDLFLFGRGKEYIKANGEHFQYVRLYSTCIMTTVVGAENTAIVTVFACRRKAGSLYDCHDVWVTEITISIISGTGTAICTSLVVAHCNNK
jgi:hypothetical protein